MLVSVLVATAIGTATANPAEPWGCTGTVVPPAGYEQDVGFAADTTAAAEAARGRLAARVCQGTDCPELAARVAIWMVGEGHGQRCAMAVLDRQLLDEWREAQSARALHATLQESLGAVLVATSHSKKRVRVALGRAKGGGQVEMWLRGQLTQALSALASVDVVNGDPKGVSVIDADFAERQERQRAVLDITVTVTRPDGTMRAVGAVLPRAAVPVEPSVEQAGAAKELSLTVRPSCTRPVDQTRFSPVPECLHAPMHPGDRVQLTVAPSAPAHLYVLAYNSLGQFQMLFPSPGQENLVDQIHRFPESGWLEFDEVKDVTDHLVVVAATARQPQLEALRGLDIPPRQQQHAPDVVVATRNFFGEVRARGFRLKTQASNAGRGGPAVPKTGPDIAPIVERGPGVAVVELTFARR